MSPASTPASAPSPTCGTAPARASTRCTASSTRPSSGSPAGRSGSARCIQRTADLGAVFYETAGLGAAAWYASNEPLALRVRRAVARRDAEWEARWWSPIINAEHLAMRDACGLVDLSAFAIFDITGPGALEAVQSLVVAQADVPRRPGDLHLAAGRRAAGPGRPHRDAAGRRALPGGHRRCHRHGREEVVHRAPAAGAHLADLTSAWTTLGVWGPGRDSSQPVTLGDLSHAGFGFGTCRGGGARRGDRARVAHLLRRGAGLGAVRADGAGRQGVGHGLGRGPAARRWCRSASASTAPPGGWRRATAPTATS